MPIIYIDSLDHPGVDIFYALTEAQLRNKQHSDKGLFIAESPKVIEVALRQGFIPTALLCEERHITGDAANIIAQNPTIPIYTGTRDVLASITGYTLSRGVLCAMKRPTLPSVESMEKALLLFNLPFTFVKGMLDVVLCLLLYKSISPLLHKFRN